MKKQIHINSLVFKIVGTVLAGIIFLSFSVGAIHLTVAKQVFTDQVVLTQKKIFGQIDYQFYKFFQDVTAITSTIARSENVEKFLTDVDMSEVESMNNSYLMERQIKESRASEHSQLNVCIIGENEKSYMNSIADRFAVPKSEILTGRAAKSARLNPNKVICQYEKQGFTENTKNTPVVIMAKALSYNNNGEANAFVFILMKEVDLRNMYSHFTSDSSNIVILNQDNQVVSSNESDYFSEDGDRTLEMEDIALQMKQEKLQQLQVKKRGNTKTYLMQQLQSTNFRMVGIISPEEVFKEQYGIMSVVLMTAFVTFIVVCLIVFFLRQQTRPLSILVHAMKHSKENRFQEHVAIKGTCEIQELSDTYNTMVDEIDGYITQLIEVEKQKRKAEIDALQMKINPHFIYNTLATVKWLIWQGDAKKSVKVIDAFIMLLRNVVSNSEEFITVEQEITNLENYALINRVRYGDDITVEFFVVSQCKDYKIPKLILQPFLENAFFHGFSDESKGSIQVFVKQEGERLRFEVRDNGAGMTKERLEALKTQKTPKKEHFTGIGIGNVDQRIRLIYGMDYGVSIESEEGKGTKVILTLPCRM